MPRSHSQRRFPVRPSSDYEDTDDSSLEETPRAAEAPPRDPARIAAITGSTPLPQVIIIYIIIIRVIITHNNNPCNNNHAAAAVLHDDGEAEQGDLVLRVAVRTEPQDLNNDHNCTCPS